MPLLLTRALTGAVLITALSSPLFHLDDHSSVAARVTTTTVPTASVATPVALPVTTTTSTTIAPRHTETVTSRSAPLTPPAPDNSVVSIALAQVGKGYVYGAVGPNVFDCSGLVYFVFNQAGIKVPRLDNLGYYTNYTHVVSPSPGDVVVFSGHIGIYVGNGEMVHAARPGEGVKLSSIDSPGKPIGYARL